MILGCCEWDEKSDIWSIACILVELYTGELFFPTHDSEEHLTLIEKISGPIPLWMAESCRKEFSKIFHEKPDAEIDKIGHRVSVLKVKKREDVVDALKSLETLEDLIVEDHVHFKQFIASLLVIDPTLRPSCKESLEHEFFKQTYTN